MSSRVAVALLAAAAIALVVAQDVVPGTSLFHTWQYALALAIVLAVLIAYGTGALRGEYGTRGKRSLLTIAGTAIVVVAGLASGLLGPDTASVIGTPGTVMPLPALGAAAFFAPADAAAIARGDSAITLRRRNAAPLEVDAGAERLLGESLVYLEPRPAAFIDAWDDRGAHLTVTQPTNASFLSPVLLFRDKQRIGAIDAPFDTFALPAKQRVLRALYFTPQALAGFRHEIADRTKPALILTIADDRGTPLGITVATSGNDLRIAGVRIRATIGTFPALAIAAAPPSWALVVGGALFLLGLAWSSLPPRSGAARSAPQPQGVGALAVPGSSSEQS